MNFYSESINLLNNAFKEILKTNDISLDIYSKFQKIYSKLEAKKENLISLEDFYFNSIEKSKFNLSEIHLIIKNILEIITEHFFKNIFE